LIHAKDGEMREIRGKEISMIFQDPTTSLNPIMRVGDQISETVKNQLKLSKEESKERAIELLKSVGIPDAPARAKLYPFEMSGGMQQRVMIALALSCDPKLLLADEPTTNLDVTIQAQVLELIRGICKQKQTSVMLITHSMGIVAWMCNRVAVMYAGRIVEIGTSKQVFTNPLHPYTRSLLKAIPKATQDTTETLYPIAGDVPNLISVPSGCSFHPRCEFAHQICQTDEPSLLEVEQGHQVSCHMLTNEKWSNSKELRSN
jgi:peptide/nickel transport system ATP-binding protein